MPAERCFSVAVLGAAAFAGALLCCLPTALPADLAAGFAGAGFDAAGVEAVRDFVPALALAGAGGGGALFRFAGSLVLVAFLAMSRCPSQWGLNRFPPAAVFAATGQDTRERRLAAGPSATDLGTPTAGRSGPS